MPTLRTLTADLNDFLGGMAVVSTARVWIEHNVQEPHALLAGDKIRIPKRWPVSRPAGSSGFTINNLVDTSSTDLNVEPGTLQYQVHVEYDDTVSLGTQRVWRSGWFFLTADSRLEDLVTDAEAVPADTFAAQRAELEAIRDEQEAIAGLTGEDDAVTFLANDSTSDLYAALVAGFARGQVVTHPRWGAGTGKTAAQNTAAIQACIDFVAAQPGKGVVYVPEGVFALGPSTLSETYDNFGTATAASAYCLVVRSGVSLVGAGRNLTELTSNDPAKTLLGLVTPVDVTVSDLRLTGGYVSGGPGPGHGIFILGATGGTNQKSERVTFRNLHVRNVSSYGIGFQNGYPRGCTVDTVLIENIGADGLDLKSRGSADTVEMYGNNVRNLVVRNHGQRVIGSAGVDVRGVWHLSNVSVTDFGTRALDGTGAPHAYVGIRFRTPSDTVNYWPGEGAKSTLTGFYVKAATSPAAADLTGVVVGSSFVNVSNGTVDGCRNGVTVGGNQLGGPSYSRLTNVHAFNSTVYGFEMLTSATGTVLANCYTSGSTTAGYRNAGVGTTFANCEAGETTKISTSVAAAATQIITGQTLSEFERGLSITSSGAGRVSVTPTGTSNDIDLWLNPKGSNGRIRVTAFTSAADAAVVGYIEVKDAAGTIRKLAVIA